MKNDVERVSINKSPLYIPPLVIVIVMVIIIRYPTHLAILRRRATRLPVDLAAFKKERNRVMNLMNEARLV